jgi:hypothetical protein
MDGDDDDGDSDVDADGNADGDDDGEDEVDGVGCWVIQWGLVPTTRPPLNSRCIVCPAQTSHIKCQHTILSTIRYWGGD